MLRLRVALSIGLSASLFAIAGGARAEDDCPLGSSQKTESGETWCEPSVCDTDTNCPTGMICRGVPLCVEIGVLDVKKDGGQKLLARQRCGADKACPQKTTCSEKSRCITRAQADKAGLTSASGPSSAAPPATSDAPAKKACGCHAPGSAGGGPLGGALAVLGALVIGARRRARKS